MIHYTLLPENEMKTLRREYRTRLLVILLFFASTAIVLGILSLIPSYILSQTQGNQALEYAKELQKGRKERGADQVEKELMQSQTLLNKLTKEQDDSHFSSVVKSIISYRSSGISLISFDISKPTGSTTPITAIVGGKALTREALIEFEKNLESEVHFTKVELPVSDLAKSRDITFALRITIK